MTGQSSSICATVVGVSESSLEQSTRVLNSRSFCPNEKALLDDRRLSSLGAISKLFRFKLGLGAGPIRTLCRSHAISIRFPKIASYNNFNSVLSPKAITALFECLNITRLPFSPSPVPSSSTMIPSSPFRPYFRIRIAFGVLVLLVLLGFCNALPFTTPLVHPKEKRSDVVCGAASWVDVVAFFLLNYVAHAATIRHFPGDSTTTQIWWTACALFVPFAGVWRGCQSIANARPFDKDALVRAKYAGALCIATTESEKDFWDSLTAFRDRGCRIKGKVQQTLMRPGLLAVW